MKIIKFVCIGLLCVVIAIVAFNISKLKLISGFAAKNMASCYFLAKQDPTLTENEDNSSFLISLAKTEIDELNKTVTASVFGMSKSKAVYRQGVGVALVSDDKKKLHNNQPNRKQKHINLPYPYGHLAAIDTVFSNINYSELDSVVTNSFVENHPDGIKNTRSILVLYKGKIIAEKYAAGFSKNSLLQGWSITKTLLSTSFGVLEQSGYDIYQPITAFPEWTSKEQQQLNTNHFLQMESGMKWEENYGKVCDVTKMLFKDSDCTQRAIKQPLVATPGTTFYYQSGNSNVLSALLRKQFKTHQEYLDFPYKTYIDKIGMHSMILETDVVGNYVASSYSWATTRDWAKFGQLFLQKGCWNNEQILSPKWVDYVTTPSPNSKGEYGGQWWLNTGGYMPNVPRDCYYADGYQGQRIFVIPSKELVIVRFGVTELGRVGFYPLFDKMVSQICATIH
ncbi:serine hydrolase domain-containing protein [Ochrovirga pacifica]|uniref:serine hydrolase domain-containing protein n=1 Tax=Ochrovirga pacifica TaxID=1042376 RepID=UPI000527B5BD|nr:serine hydrolase [Ochrovirga pacifica]